MAFYDTPGLQYDSGATYDSAPAPQPKGKKVKIKLGLDGLTPEGVVALANTVKTMMTGNVNFPTPNPTLAALGAQATTVSGQIAAYETLVASEKPALAARDAGTATLCSLLTQEAAYVENVSGGDPVKIESAGFSVRSPKTPPSVPGQLMNLVLTAGDFPGTLDAAWDPTAGSKLYEIQTSPDPMSDSTWVPKTTCTKSSKTVDGLTSATKVWVRARANGAAGPGPWSDPATKVVP